MNSLCAQLNDQHDTSIIKSYTDKIIVKLNLEKKTESYLIDYESENKQIQLIFNEQKRYNLSLDYEFIGVSFYFNPQFISTEPTDSLKRVSRSFGIKYFFFLNQWVHKVEFSKAKGFYLIDSEIKSIERENESKYSLFPDLKKIEWSGSTAYIFNPKFSLRNILYQTEWQKKSAGSFIPTVHYSYIKFLNRPRLLNSFSNQTSLDLALAYYHTLVFRENWFASFIFQPSMGYYFTNQKQQEQGIPTFDIRSTYTFNGKVQFGYSSEKVIFGIDLKASIKTDVSNQYKNKFQQQYAKIYLGYRFDTPKYIKRPFDRWFK